MPSFQERVRRIVFSIPEGRVCSYGTVAELAGSPRAARAVGAALRAIDDEDLPWWRVVSARGTISTSSVDHTAQLQRALLEDEGVTFDEGGRIEMEVHAWPGDRDTP